VPQDGLVVFSGGHLHDGGVDIRLRNNGTPICIATATYHEEPHHLASINSCSLHARVRPGDTMTVAARYENSQPLVDVMGIMLTYVWWGTQ
jgi:hypothetical protein